MKSKKVSFGFVLRFLTGESIPEALAEFLAEKKINSAVIHGIGALSKAEIGHFSFEKKKYDSMVFEEDLEVLSFEGNVSLKQGKPFSHIHVSLGRKDFSVIGGHLVSGIVGATLELFVKPFSDKLERKKQDSGLFLLDL